MTVDPTITKILILLPIRPPATIPDGIAGTYHFPSPDSLNGTRGSAKLSQISDKHQLTCARL